VEKKIIPYPPTGEFRGCAAAYFRQLADVALNEGARREADEATDELVPLSDAPEMYRVYDDGHAVVSFQPTEMDCSLCSGAAQIDSEGGVYSADCLVSGSCELSWARMYPEQYTNEEGELAIDRLPCYAEKCSAVIALSQDTLGVSVATEGCIVDIEGEKFKTSGRERLNTMPLTAPEAGIEAFDGERLVPAEDEQL
jgi:hypothetical protein